MNERNVDIDIQVPDDDPDLQKFRTYMVRLQKQQKSTCAIQLLENKGHQLVESQWISELSGCKTLEIGIGGGQHISHVKNLEHYYGVDINYDFLRDLREKNSLPLAVGKIQNLPFTDESFDRVVAMGVLEHLRGLDSCLKEIARVMKSTAVFDAVMPPEGGFLYSVLYRQLVTIPQLKAQGISDPLRLIRLNHCNAVPHILDAMTKHFKTTKHRYWPIRCLGLHLSVLVSARAVKQTEHFIS